MNSEWLNPRPDNRRFAVAFGVGLLLEAGALLLLLPVLAHRQAPSDTPSVIKLSIVAPAPTPKPPPPKPKPVPPKPVVPPPPPPPPPQPVPKPLPMPPPPRPAVHHIVRRYIPRPVTPPPPPVVQPPVVQAPPPPQVPPAPTGGEVDAFEASVKRALQADANEVYPAAAQMAHETGNPELTFTYLNGVVTNITLTQSCGFPLLDDAALEDARIAHYPPPPAGFAGRRYQFTVSVTFMLAAPDVDGD